MKINTLMWIRLPKQKLAKPLTVPETRLEKQIAKYTHTFTHISWEKANGHLTATNNLMFQYEAAIDAFTIKIRNVMNSNQVICTLRLY